MVRPEVRVSDFVLNLTGINHDDLDKAPLFTDISAEFNQFIKNSMIVAHNAFLDRMSYESICHYYNCLPEPFVWVDSQDIFKWLNPTIHTLQLQQLFHTYGIEQDHSHRALDDAMGLARLLIYYSHNYQLKLTSFEVSLLKQSSLKSIQQLTRFVLRFFSVNAPDDTRRHDIDQHGYAEFTADPTGHQQVSRFLGDDRQCLAFISSFKERTVCIVRSQFSLEMPYINSPDDYAYPPNIDMYYPKLMAHRTSHSEIAEIVAIMSWFRQTNTFFVNELHDSLKRRFFMNKDSSFDGFSVEKAMFLASKIEHSIQLSGFVACHVDSFTQISKHLPQFWGLFTILFYHYSNFDGVFSHHHNVQLSTSSFKFLNEMVIQFSDIIGFLRTRNKDGLNLIQDVARIRHLVDLIHDEKNQLLQQMDALVSALSINHYYSQREVYVNENVIETYEWQEIKGHINLIQHQLVELKTILGRVSYYILPDLSVWIRDVILNLSYFNFLLKQFEQVPAKQSVTYISAPIKYRPSNCCLQFVAIQPTELFQKVINFAGRTIFYQSIPFFNSIQYLSSEIGVNVTDNQYSDSVPLPIQLVTKVPHDMVVYIQQKLMQVNVLIVLHSKSKMRFWKKVTSNNKTKV